MESNYPFILIIIRKWLFDCKQATTNNVAAIFLGPQGTYLSEQWFGANSSTVAIAAPSAAEDLPSDQAGSKKTS